MSHRSAGEAATMACLLEAIAPKPGNVHRGADFDNLTFQDFAVSAAILGQVIGDADRQSVGWLVRQSQERIRRQVGRNTYLGTILLLAPMAKSTWRYDSDSGGYTSDIQRVIQNLTPADASDVYEAIRLADPGGLGSVAAMDVHGPPPPDLLAAMECCQGSDLIAYQYTHLFATVVDDVLPVLDRGLHHGWTVAESIVYAHVLMMARYPDSLIARKVGPAVAVQSQQRAAAVLDAGPPGSTTYRSALAEFDSWLRMDGNRRNPGTTADLVAAGLFVLLRIGRIPLPIR